jgi:hypothetical protein
MTIRTSSQAIAPTPIVRAKTAYTAPPATPSKATAAPDDPHRETVLIRWFEDDVDLRSTPFSCPTSIDLRENIGKPPSRERLKPSGVMIRRNLDGPAGVVMV